MLITTGINFNLSQCKELQINTEYFNYHKSITTVVDHHLFSHKSGVIESLTNTVNPNTQNN